MVAQAVSFDFLWHHSYHLHVQWDLRIFYPEHFLKTPPCIISSAFWYIGCLCGIYKLHFGLIQKILPPYQSRVIFTSPCRIQRGAPGLTEFKPVVLENHDLKWWNYSAMQWAKDWAGRWRPWLQAWVCGWLSVVPWARHFPPRVLPFLSCETRQLGKVIFSPFPLSKDISQRL